jgi:hypothetical protein
MARIARAAALISAAAFPEQSEKREAFFFDGRVFEHRAPMIASPCVPFPVPR